MLDAGFIRPASAWCQGAELGWGAEGVFQRTPSPHTLMSTLLIVGYEPSQGWDGPTCEPDLAQGSSECRCLRERLWVLIFVQRKLRPDHYKRALPFCISICDYNWVAKGQDLTFRNTGFLNLGVWRKYFPLKRGPCITQFEPHLAEYKLWGVFVPLSWAALRSEAFKSFSC